MYLCCFCGAAACFKEVSSPSLRLLPHLKRLYTSYLLVLIIPEVSVLVVTIE